MDDELGPLPRTAAGRALLERIGWSDSEGGMADLAQPGIRAVEAEAGELDAAWAEVEAALPEGWKLWELARDEQQVEFQGGRKMTILPWRAEARGPWGESQYAGSDTPIAALRALAEKLRSR